MSKSSLADKISDLLNTAPKLIDPEDDDVNYTQTNSLLEDIQHEDSDDDDNSQEELLSQFRKQNVDLLADVDVRYVGKKASRKKLQESDEDISDNSDEGNDTSEEESDRSSVENNDITAQSIDEESEVEEESGTEGSEDDEIDFGDDSMITNTDDKTNFKHMKETNMSSQVMKGLCVRNQMSIWETLLEMRIQLQKCLITSNKLPQSETFIEIKKESGQIFTDKIAEAKQNVSNVLDKFLLLQKLLLKQYPETTKLNKKEIPEKLEDSDEEIPSDTEEENSEVDSNSEDNTQKTSKKRKLNEYEEEISQQFKRYRFYRNNVIQKWNDKTRIAVAKSNTPSHSALNQIEHTLNDKPRLIKRTQLKRSEYEIIGESNKSTIKPETEQEIVNDNKIIEEYNNNIFDDDDFYHQLLRELIEVKSADLTDPVQLGRQWIQLQNLRSKMKRKIDTKATKGRKIRYAVHTKLVNFMAPIDENLWTDEAKNELYSSLFGKNQPTISI